MVVRLGDVGYVTSHLLDSVLQEELRHSTAGRTRNAMWSMVLRIRSRLAVSNEKITWLTPTLLIPLQPVGGHADVVGRDDVLGATPGPRSSSNWTCARPNTPRSMGPRPIAVASSFSRVLAAREPIATTASASSMPWWFGSLTP